MIDASTSERLVSLLSELPVGALDGLPIAVVVVLTCWSVMGPSTGSTS